MTHYFKIVLMKSNNQHRLVIWNEVSHGLSCGKCFTFTDKTRKTDRRPDLQMNNHFEQADGEKKSSLNEPVYHLIKDASLDVTTTPMVICDGPYHTIQDFSNPCPERNFGRTSKSSEQCRECIDIVDYNMDVNMRNASTRVLFFPQNTCSVNSQIDEFMHLCKLLKGMMHEYATIHSDSDPCNAPLLAGEGNCSSFNYSDRLANNYSLKGKKIRPYIENFVEEIVAKQLPSFYERDGATDESATAVAGSPTQASERNHLTVQKAAHDELSKACNDLEVILAKLKTTMLQLSKNCHTESKNKIMSSFLKEPIRHEISVKAETGQITNIYAGKYLDQNEKAKDSYPTYINTMYTGLDNKISSDRKFLYGGENDEDSPYVIGRIPYHIYNVFTDVERATRTTNTMTLAIRDHTLSDVECRKKKCINDLTDRRGHDDGSTEANVDCACPYDLANSSLFSSSDNQTDSTTDSIDTTSLF